MSELQRRGGEQVNWTWMDEFGRSLKQELVALVSRILSAMGCLGCCFGLKRKQAKSKGSAYNVVQGGASQERLLKLPADATSTSGRRSYVGQECSGSATGRQSIGLAEGTGWLVDLDARPEVKVTSHADTSQDHEGHRMINQYVRESVIGVGSYGKVILHRSLLDDKLYAIKLFRKSRLRKKRVSPFETAMSDVLREVDIMKRLNHPNVVRLVEVIDDPECEHLYMVMEYVEGQRIFEGSGPPGGLAEHVARRYFRDVVSGLIYLHANKVIHGDIKPENLMVTTDGHIKIGDFGVSKTFEDENDFLRRSPGTPVYTAPECCKGLYRGRPADVWALGVTLYCMVTGNYPFVGETLQDTYDKIVEQELVLPLTLDPDLRDLLSRLLCKDPVSRITLEAASRHPWVTKDE